MLKHSIIILVLLLSACGTKNQTSVTNPDDYNAYLITQEFTPESKYFNLWNDKIKPDSTQTLSLAIAAGEYERFFKASGNITFLKNAESALIAAVDASAIGRANFLRALARNYIAQHRFKEADSLAVEARRIGSGVRESQALLFDTSMELGNYKYAEAYLDSLKNLEDFGYLVRLAKFNDHKGDLNTAIRTLEKAKNKADNAKNSAIRIWSYTNLADYYGHAGMIPKAYELYLKTLELDPHNAYAKKGIAWIVYSHENNPKEALRILDSVTKFNSAPDYFLLKAEMASFAGLQDLEAVYKDTYIKNATKPEYGIMYNLPNAKWYMDQNLDKALMLAEQEVANRPTPETFSLLALIKNKRGEKEEALELIRDKVVGKSSEPTILLIIAQIYKDAKREQEVAEIKRELTEAKFELGPMVMDEVNAL